MIRMFERARRHRLLLAVLLIASLTIVTLDFRSTGPGPLDAVGRVTLSVLGPVQRGLSAIVSPIGGFLSGLGRGGSLRSQVDRLERENAQLRAREQQVADIERENARLRRQDALKDRFNLRTVAASVTGVSPSNFERSVFIDRGSADGLRKDMPVIGDGGLVGRIIKISKDTSVVGLIVDRQSAVAGRLTTTGETGVLEGTGTGLLRFELLDPAAKVAVGDRVVTSGYDRGLYPAGLPVGTVIEAPPAQSNLSRIVTVRPFVDFSSLDFVFPVLGEQG